MYSKKILICVLVLALVCQAALAVPMLYEKRIDGKFEADLVAVSSTVIPLSVLEVSYGKNGKPSEEYKMAYLKKLMKKVKHQDGEDDIDPDTLITIKSKGKHIESKAKVKAN
ncbi:hypothetical protein ACFFRR_006177 [Megaselia abdita]